MRLVGMVLVDDMEMHYLKFQQNSGRVSITSMCSDAAAMEPPASIPVASDPASICLRGMFMSGFFHSHIKFKIKEDGTATIIRMMKKHVFPAQTDSEERRSSWR